MIIVAIHNKNGQGLLQLNWIDEEIGIAWSQSTIKMDKGYYWLNLKTEEEADKLSQSTIKMDKGYYLDAATGLGAILGGRNPQ